ncbi:hypothetical protein IPZ58_15315 [Streptomyces roseoverticillatus]|uniref:hypothetical protein n=1 Tax=Streptomyces roseoverticillatus TaxID=66429 RepID=UPI001F48C528|nr:hypothetical protein [Streptomyces roseoverticillatus]MCF3102949.1 hypothetical protein [Streptomyces roseoverticillatus]
MFGTKSQNESSSDLCAPEAVEAGQQVYDRIVAGQCKDVAAELDAVHGRTGDGERRR